jgi:hypothetical protein
MRSTKSLRVPIVLEGCAGGDVCGSSVSEGRFCALSLTHSRAEKKILMRHVMYPTGTINLGRRQRLGRRCAVLVSCFVAGRQDGMRKKKVGGGEYQKAERSTIRVARQVLVGRRRVRIIRQ